MTLASRSEIVSALAQHRAQELAGTAENSWLDFKTTPYAINTDKGKFELAKDVAALANAQGGLLVCGARTAARTTEAKDVVEELTAFPEAHARTKAAGMSSRSTSIRRSPPPSPGTPNPRRRAAATW